jgi:hypothetical protein
MGLVKLPDIVATAFLGVEHDGDKQIDKIMNV